MSRSHLSGCPQASSRSNWLSSASTAISTLVAVLVGWVVLFSY